MKKIIHLFIFLCIALSFFLAASTEDSINQEPRELTIQENIIYTNLLVLHKNGNLNKDSIHQLEGQPDIDTCIAILTLRKKKFEFNLLKLKESRLPFTVASLLSLSLAALGEYWRREHYKYPQTMPAFPNPPAGITIHMGPNTLLFGKVLIGTGAVLSFITIPIFILLNVGIHFTKKELTIISDIIQELNTLKYAQ